MERFRCLFVINGGSGSRFFGARDDSCFSIVAVYLELGFKLILGSRIVSRNLSISSEIKVIWVVSMIMLLYSRELISTLS